MYYRDHQAGVPEDFFRYKAKKELITILLNRLQSNHKLKILNVGSGTGDDLAPIKEFGDIYVVDVDPNAIAMVPDSMVAEKKLRDACELPYNDNFFDLAVAFDVLEHIEDDRKAVYEIMRVLKPGGYFVFILPACSFLYGSHDRALDHYRRYNKSTIRTLLSDLACVELGYWTFSLFLPVAIQRFLTRKSEPKIQYFRLPNSINQLFYYMLRAENWLIKRGVSFPIGVSIYGIYHKLLNGKDIYGQ